MSNPLKIEVRVEDNRISFLGYIEVLDKYLRVVTLNDGKTVHNAFIDRDFVEKEINYEI